MARTTAAKGTGAAGAARKPAAAGAATKAGAKQAQKTAARPASKAAAKPVAKPAAKPAPKPAARAPAKAAARPGVPARVTRNKAEPAQQAAREAARKLVAPAAKRGGKAGARPVAQAAPGNARVDARPALVRDSFTMPEEEYAVLAAVKQACLKAGFEVKKTELLRMGVALLGQLDIASLRAVLGSLPQLRTGRPPAA
jgi:hypothetical protein